MLPTSLLFLATAVVVVSAFPVESGIEARVCGQVLLPSTQIQLKESDPNTAFPNTALTDRSVLIYQDVNGATGQVTNKINELIAFAGPVGAYGCTLGITFPSDYTFPFYTGAAPTVNIYTVSTPLPSSPTYNNVPINPSLFGTVTVKAGQSTVINSASCPTNAQGGLAFVFTYPDWVQAPASIGWSESAVGETLRGVYLSYDC